MQIQLSPNKAARKIPIDVPTRWNAKYFMLKVALEQRTTIDAIFSTAGFERQKSVKFSEKDWVCVGDLLQLLEPFDVGTRMVFSKGYPTISTVIPLMKKMKGHLEKFSTLHPSWKKVFFSALTLFRCPEECVDLPSRMRGRRLC